MSRTKFAMNSSRFAQMRNATIMSLSLITLGFAAHAADATTAVAASATTADADTDAPPAPPPNHAAFKAAMEKCHSASGLAKGVRPTEAQHEAMEACMKAAGFEKPPGGPHGHHHHHGPPPEGKADDGDSDGSSSGSEK